MQLHENEEIRQRALLVAVDTGEYDAEASMAELYELAKTAGAEVVSDIIQKRDAVKTATCVGSGCLEQIDEFCKANEIDLLIFDRELTPTQIRNIEEKTGVRVVDRTMLILDIFAQRARSKEGKLQVELAQLQYMLPRLSGRGTALSRLGGGIGTRGPGETKLETDRRHIRARMEKIKERLKDSESHREQLKKRRKKTGVITVAIVGYTNAGKSTLMNYLTDAGVLAQDKLFATLDPTSRALKLKNGVSVMLIDTVGLVRRLPHHLVEAFKSTLEEAAQADIILNVCDASSEEAALHLEVTQKLLESLGCHGSPIIPVLNKCDMLTGLDSIPMIGKAVRISAKTGYGVDKLLDAIEENLPVRMIQGKWLLPFDKVGIAAEIRRDGNLISEEYTAEGLEIEAVVEDRLFCELKSYEI